MGKITHRCATGDLDDTGLHFGATYPKTPPKWAEIGIFKLYPKKN